MTKSKKNCASVLTDEGLSYVETLLSLSIVSLIAFMLPGIFSVFTELEMVDTNLEGDIFIMDIMEISGSAKSAKTVGSSTISFKTELGHVEYSYNNSRVIKSISGKGFITMMFDVASWEMSENDDMINISIKTNGEFNETLTIKK